MGFKRVLFANSEEPDEMHHYAAFHQSLHCLLRKKRSTDQKNTIFFLKKL